VVGNDSEPVLPAGGRLDDRVLEALNAMHGRMAFSGLRRSLHAHPESLARALRRLEREGLVERSSDGYRALAAPRPLSGDGTDELHPVARIAVPFGVDADAVLARLTGRWFGGLRWVGVVERPPRRLLAWARRDGSGSVYLGLQGGALRIFTPGAPGTPDGNDGDDAAYELLVAVAAALRPTVDHRAVTFLSAARDPVDALGPADN
jgi:hypothetical protein